MIFPDKRPNFTSNYGILKPFMHSALVGAFIKGKALLRAFSEHCEIREV